MTRIAVLHKVSVHPSRLVERVRPEALRKRLHPAALLGGAVFLALVAMSALPAARGVSDWFGLVPLWLLGMPVTALVALEVSRRAGRARLHARRRAVSAPRRAAGTGAVPRRQVVPRQAVRRAVDRAA